LLRKHFTTPQTPKETRELFWKLQKYFVFMILAWELDYKGLRSPPSNFVGEGWVGFGVFILESKTN